MVASLIRPPSITTEACMSPWREVPQPVYVPSFHFVAGSAGAAGAGGATTGAETTVAVEAGACSTFAGSTLCSTEGGASAGKGAGRTIAGGAADARTPGCVDISELVDGSASASFGAAGSGVGEAAGIAICCAASAA